MSHRCVITGRWVGATVSSAQAEQRQKRERAKKKNKQNKTCSLTGPARKTQGPWPFACYCHNCWIMTPYNVHFPHLHIVSQVSYITYIYTNLSQTLCLISLKWGTETLFFLNEIALLWSWYPLCVVPYLMNVSLNILADIQYFFSLCYLWNNQ